MHDIHEFQLDNGKAYLAIPVPLTPQDKERLHGVILTILECAFSAEAQLLIEKPETEKREVDRP